MERKHFNYCRNSNNSSAEILFLIFLKKIDGDDSTIRSGAENVYIQITLYHLKCSMQQTIHNRSVEEVVQVII